MNQQVAPLSTAEVNIATKGSGSSLAPESLGEVVRFAQVMAQGGIALPKHLREQPGACMAVAMQALEWGMSPFAVASKSYSVNGAIAYEAQLIAAVVNTRSGIKGRLKYEFEGEGPSLQCTVSGELDGEVFSYTSPRVDQITPKNSPLWKTDPQQQLGYYSARAWARRYTPEVLLGVYDREEVQEMRDVTPEPKQSMLERLPDKSEADEGFDVNHVIEETTSADTEALSPPQSEEETGGETPASEDPPVSPIVGVASRILGYANSVLEDIQAETVTPDECIRIQNRNLNAEYEKISEAEHEQLDSVVKSSRAIMKGQADYDKAIEFFAGVFEVEEAALRAE